jgi:hypothetical protein
LPGSDSRAVFSILKPVTPYNTPGVTTPQMSAVAA